MRKDARQIVRRPLITERATQLQEKSNKYLFEVHPDANKIEVRRAVEQSFKVAVTNVNTMKVKA